MKTFGLYQQRATARDLLYFATPRLWPQHPFLPIVRRFVGSDDCDCGVLYDAHSVSGLYGLSATVFLTNLFQIPPTEAEFLALPKCVYDTVEEMAADGWTVD